MVVGHDGMQLFNEINLRNIRGDLFGGITAAVIALPMALAFVPGLPAHGYGHVWYLIPLWFFWRKPAERRRLLLYIAGVLLWVIAFPDPDLGFLGWILLWPYLLAREQDDGANWWRAAYLFGFLRISSSRRLSEVMV